MDNSFNEEFAHTKWNNLPPQLTPYITRETEETEVRNLLLRESVRMVTLTGVGGVGKTRLGLRVAEQLLPHFSNGVVFVPLAPVGNPELLFSAIADELRKLVVLDGRDEPPEETVVRCLADKHLLLVLDNIEVIMPEASKVTTLLIKCPRLKVLATSREISRTRLEYNHKVPMLSSPDEPDSKLTVEQLLQYEAIALFVQRAQQATGLKFELSQDNRDAVVEICRRLQGLALAIELAAARLIHDDVEQVRQNLRKDILFNLNDGSRDAESRHRTMRDAISWTYMRLEPEVQDLFRWLGVFRGGRTRNSAAAIYDFNRHGISVEDLHRYLGDNSEIDDDTVKQLHPVDALLKKLVDVNLIYCEQPAEKVPEGLEGNWQPQPRRYMMYETIHEYAREQLAARGEIDKLRLQHGQFFVALAERAEPELKLADREMWLRRLEVEHDNFRLVLKRALKALGGKYGDPKLERELATLGMRLAGALWRFWLLRGHISDGREWLKLLREGSSGIEPPFDASVRAKMLNGLGNLIWSREHSAGADYEEARACHKGALALWEESGNLIGQVVALINLGVVEEELKHYDIAFAHYRECLNLLQPIAETEPLILAYSLEGLATLAAAQDAATRAGKLAGAAEALRKKANAPRTKADHPNYDPLIEAAMGKAKKKWKEWWVEGQNMSVYTKELIRYASRNDHGRFTEAEHKMLPLIVDGKCAKQIACELAIGVSRVYTRRDEIFKKIQAEEQVELSGNKWVQIANWVRLRGLYE